MTGIVFRRVTPQESRIYVDGDLAGEVYRQDSVFQDAPHHYVVHLNEDPRGPARIRDRNRIRELTRHRVETHPLWRA